VKISGEQQRRKDLMTDIDTPVLDMLAQMSEGTLERSRLGARRRDTA
jgi:hypothetical protein